MKAFRLGSRRSSSAEFDFPHCLEAIPNSPLRFVCHWWFPFAYADRHFWLFDGAAGCLWPNGVDHLVDLAWCWLPVRFISPTLLDPRVVS
jgi:hypothetical protein